MGWVARLKSDVSPASSIRLNASGGRMLGRWEVDRHQAHGPVICSSLPPSQEGSKRRKEGSSRHPGVEQQQMGGQDNANRPPSCRVPRVLSPDGGCPIRHKRAGLAAPCSSQKVYGGLPVKPQTSLIKGTLAFVCWALGVNYCFNKSKPVTAATA